jgi:hypothetical protein
MPNQIHLQDIPTVRELFAKAALQDVETPVYPPNRSLLNRVHLGLAVATYTLLLFSNSHTSQGDITQIEVDAIVNAANSRLLGESWPIMCSMRTLTQYYMAPRRGRRFVGLSSALIV